jgi:fluoride exporter
MTYLWIALGGALGSVTRFWISNVVTNRFGAALPWGTLFVNVSGSLVIGLVAGLSTSNGRLASAESFRHFFVVGVCGGYTTFSAFSMQTLDLARAGNPLAAGGNVLLSMVLCLAAVWLGFAVGSALNGRS